MYTRVKNNWFFNYFEKKKIGVLKVMTDVVLKDVERQKERPTLSKTTSLFLSSKTLER